MKTETAKRESKETPRARPAAAKASAKYVYAFDEIQLAERAVGSWEGVRALLGGKGANLGEMTKLKLPVPPGFVVTTEACKAFLAGGEKFPKGMWEQVLAAVRAARQP